MIYSATITTSANTTEGTATKTTLEITKGLIWLFEIEFPAGCCGLVKIQIFDGSYQVLPATPGESLRGEAVNVKYDDLYFKNNAPFKFIIKTWNMDEIYDHTIQVRIGVACSEAFMSRYMPSVTWDKFNDSLIEALSKQETIKQEAIAKLQEEIPAETETEEEIE